MSFIELINQRKPLVVQLVLLCFHAVKNIDSCLRIHEFFGVEPVDELLDCIFLLNLVESDNALFPCLIQTIKLLFFIANNVVVEFVTFLMLS